MEFQWLEFLLMIKMAQWHSILQAGSNWLKAHLGLYSPIPFEWPFVLQSKILVYLLCNLSWDYMNAILLSGLLNISHKSYAWKLKIFIAQCQSIRQYYIRKSIFMSESEKVMGPIGPYPIGFRSGKTFLRHFLLNFSVHILWKIVFHLKIYTQIEIAGHKKRLDIQNDQKMLAPLQKT